MHLLAYAVSTTTGNLHLSVCGKSPLLRWHKSLPEISSLFCLFLLHRNIFLSRKMTPRTLGEGLFSVLSKEQGTPGSAALWLPGCFPRLFFCDLLSTYWTILDKQRPSEFNPGTPNCLYGYQHQTCDHLQSCCGRDPTPTWTLPRQHLPLIPQEQPHAYSLPGIQGRKRGKEGCEMTQVQTGRKGLGNYCYSNTHALSLSWQWLQGYQTLAFEYLCSIWCPKQKLVTPVNLMWSLKIKSSWSVVST